LPIGAPAQPGPPGENGIKLGDGRLHPYIQVDSKFVVNPGRQSDNQANDLVFVARPGLELLLPSDTLDMTFKGDVEWQQYTGVDESTTRELSTFAGSLALDLNVNKRGAVGFRLSDRLTRSADPGNQTISRRLLSTSNDLGLGLDVRPGGGALTVSADGGFYIERYDREENATSDSSAYSPSDLDNYRLAPQLKVAWKFLPKTAVFLDAEGLLTNYYNSTANESSNILRVHLGAAGSISQKIALLLKAGYGDTFLSGDSFRSFIGQAEFNYLASETMRLRLGVLRTVQPTSVFRYFSMIRGYVGYDQAVGGSLQLGLKLGYNYLSYGEPGAPFAAAGVPGGRSDGQITADIFVAYQINEWLTLSVHDRVDQRSTSWAPASGVSPEYFTNDFFVRVAARY
jgi:hypothetical protein